MDIHWNSDDTCFICADYRKGFVIQTTIGPQVICNECAIEFYMSFDVWYRPEPKDEGRTLEHVLKIRLKRGRK